MGLRRQLLLFGSLSLALPWAGVQYVREMELALRQGQAMALQATAQAVAARVASDELLLQNISGERDDRQGTDSESVIYAHSTELLLPLDGYDDDWRSLAKDWQSLRSVGQHSAPAKVVAARRGVDLHLFIEVADEARQFYDPSDGVQGADRVELLVAGKDSQAPTRLRLYSAAPGPVLVESFTQAGEWVRDYRVQAIWNEREEGYALEVRMPFRLVAKGLQLAAIDGRSTAEEVALWLQSAQLRTVVTRSDLLDSTLHIFSPEGMRLYLIDRVGWIYAKSGALHGAPDRAALAQLQRQWVRRLVGQRGFPRLDDVETRGAFDPEQVQGAVTSEQATAWYRYGDGLVGRTFQPIKNPTGETVAMVVAEQTTDSLDRLTSGAAGRLLLYSMAAAMIAAIGLLGFASVLSYRVRRLSRQAQAAVDGDGRIAGTFHGSRNRDELGELSRQYAALLERLGTYTQYLETLASKLSHELRTPLAIVRTSLDNLSHVSLSQEAQTYVARASGGSERLSAILNAMSAASRLEQSIESSEREPVDLREMLPHVAAAYEALYPSVKIRLSMAPEGDAQVSIAPELWVQMLDKLVDNAVDFSDQGSPVDLCLLCQAGQVTLQVINSGSPIPASMLNTIFDPLISARQPGDDGSQHLGLGLYIVRLIAQFHGAKLRAVNDLANGQVIFEVTMPTV